MKSKVHRKFSVIIPCHCWEDMIGEKGIERYFSCLFHESNARFIQDVTIVDDHSPDKEFKRLQKIIAALQLPNTSLHKLPGGDKAGGNRAAARNYGRAQATSDSLFFLDQDSLMSRNFFAILCEQINAHGEDTGFCAHRIHELDRAEAGEKNTPFESFSVAPYTTCACNFEAGHGCHSTFSAMFSYDAQKMFKRMLDRDRSVYSTPALHHNPMHFISYAIYVSATMYDAVGGFSERFHGWGEEDLDFGWRLYKAGFKTYTSDRNLIVWHHEHPVDGHRRLDEWLVNALLISARNPDLAKIRERQDMLFGLACAASMDCDATKGYVLNTFRKWLKWLSLKPEELLEEYEIKPSKTFEERLAERAEYRAKAKPIPESLKHYYNAVLEAAEGASGNVLLLGFIPAMLMGLMDRGNVLQRNELGLRQLIAPAGEIKMNFEDETFDMVLMEGLFERLFVKKDSLVEFDAPIALWKEIVRVLKPEGRFIFAARNRFCVDTFNKYLRGESALIWGPSIHGGGNAYELTAKEIRQLAERAGGLEILSLKSVETLPRSESFEYNKEVFEAMIKRPLEQEELYDTLIVEGIKRG